MPPLRFTASTCSQLILYHCFPTPALLPAQVVDAVAVPSDISGKQAVYCRCWRSDTFPLCNGAHVKHNAATGDNVGPLILKKDE